MDYPNSSKAKKLYLCLFTGGAPVSLPVPLGVQEVQQVSVVSDTLYWDNVIVSIKHGDTWDILCY